LSGFGPPDPPLTEEGRGGVGWGTEERAGEGKEGREERGGRDREGMKEYESLAPPRGKILSTPLTGATKATTLSTAAVYSKPSR